MKKMIQFFKECVGELKKVTWPTFGDAMSSVKIVLVSTVVIAIILGLLDWLFTLGLQLIF